MHHAHWAAARARQLLSSVVDRWCEGGAVHRSLGWTRHRPARVVILLFAVMAMSIADLIMTLTYATSVGMVELNPLARAMMSGSTRELVVWKLATVLLGTGILFFIRRTRGGEFGAWVCALVLGALTCHWINYNREASLLTRELHIVSQADDIGFVQMTTR